MATTNHAVEHGSGSFHTFAGRGRRWSAQNRPARLPRNEMMQVENLSDVDLEDINETFEKIRAECERRTPANKIALAK